MECEIVIRRATPQDKVARAELIERGITGYDSDAIIFFIFQELMLQLSVLAGAVLFIFAGAPLWACAAAPLALAAAAALGVVVTHRALARVQASRMRRETVGFVAEYRGPLGGDPRVLSARVVTSPSDDATRGPRHSRLVGTLSVADFHGARHSAWLFGFAVDAPWQRRGVGSALLGAGRAWAAEAGLESLEAAASALQPKARALLHSNGWELRGSYHRQLLGAALTLPMLHMGLELHA